MPGIITGPGISGIQDANEHAAFANAIAAATGLDPRVVYTWAQEETGGHPYAGGHNWLNLRPYPGDPYVGVSPGGFEEYASVQQAEQATIRRLRQPFASGILASRGQPPQSEIAAIAASDWDAGHYGGPGGPSLVNVFRSLYPDVAISSPAAHTPINSATGSPSGGIVAGTESAVGGVFGGVESVVIRGLLILGGTLVVLVGLYLIVRSFGLAPGPLDVLPVGRIARKLPGGSGPSDADVGRQVKREDKRTARRQAREHAATERAREKKLAEYGEVPF